ncbi:MAG: hypothetical protein UV61_C0008G0005 [Candidatus Gottesmanbacteria bacterium GW2011_GWB1_43_11]|uniref:Uncharacterized protein n=1 Tax=Candidatus Gottesmanbacteria bacterium GW2011_GWB1_43_11 TaxID=1618446 RepID=A0A0G1CM17_9BACT|nr:MAG: hypothetical protein UV04_C0003G0005 [Candidatus Gottesmanbacteria bacterium GW2011_GWA2_42_16]KKS54148.1 MAG: hypothetical protein UV17_C0025G0005 [Candidatus Gottesmanbacteria bacterium GW2011_GWA1_42_26]KKS86552.1 MAG: hypothetical protein UV61_C0008G0005 [Candidatus Gottesmanbacteria bacterium GW2011_GWB1_43_11]OGG10683.1 MAG: hypothetical protein A2699_04460 [Candidatus Gottesmanbacteria bacterium RIFCSPHIGHO2_01_FULL_43_15]OGG28305.1 MAG: hypothetical protein A3A59_04595 [Candidat
MSKKPGKGPDRISVVGWVSQQESAEVGTFRYQALQSIVAATNEVGNNPTSCDHFTKAQQALKGLSNHQFISSFPDVSNAIDVAQQLIEVTHSNSNQSSHTCSLKR